MPKDGSEQKDNFLDFIRIPSRLLKIIAAQHQKTFTSERFSEFIEYIRKIFSQYYSCLAEFEPGIDRAMMAHRLMNQAIQQSPEMKASCTRGCGACCHMEVEVTTDEGKLLAELVNGGVEIDREKLQVQAARERLSPDWGRALQESNRCVFLGENQECRIYDFRPMACRKHLVTSPPEQCASLSDKIDPILLPLAEIALSAALSQPGNTFCSISKGITAFLVKKEEKDSKEQAKEKPNDQADLPLGI